VREAGSETYSGAQLRTKKNSRTRPIARGIVYRNDGPHPFGARGPRELDRLMPSSDELQKLRMELEGLRAERDAAVRAEERLERESAEQVKLLVEEQDRFVSRLLEGHERDVGRLRLELDEARTSAQRLEQKLDKDRARTARLEEDLVRVRGDVDRIRDQRDAFRTELKKAQQAYLALQTTTERLDGEVKLARSMLSDAMEGGSRWESAKPPTSQHEISRPPRESGIQDRRDRALRSRIPTPPGRPRIGSNPPGHSRRSDGPRAAVGADGVEEGPPSSR